MSSEHTISIATDTAGHSNRGAAAPVSMPVEELMAGNGLITGQSGADPAASARLIAESLLDAGETLLLVDPAGEFDGLTDHAAVLHVGGDRNCDVEVRPDAVDRVAALALDGNTSIALDLSAFDAAAADDILGSLTNALVDDEHDRRSDLLLIANECERWLAANGPATRTGENMVALGGRRHADVGILGVTDQPADLREDVLSGVDWVLAHRVTWREDVRALETLLDREYVDDLEDLDEDEAFFNAGWDRGVKRLRLGTDVDLGAETARIEKSEAETQESADDLLASIPEARSPTGDDRDGDSVREELEAIENRLASLEAKLEAREDVETMADRIADAITDGLENAQIGESTAPRRQPDESPQQGPSGSWGDSSSANTRESDSTTDRSDATADDSSAGVTAAADAGDSTDDGSGAFGNMFGMFDDDDTADAGASASGGATGSASADRTGTEPDSATSTNGAATSNGTTSGRENGNERSSNGGNDSGGMSFEPIDFGFEEGSQDIDSTIPDDFGPPARHDTSGRTIPRYLRKIVRNLEEMDVTTRRMLAYYIDQGTESPMDAHVSAGGAGDRTRAYAHNRQLRTNGLIEHVGKGEYGPRLREYVVDQAGHSVPEHELDRAVEVITQTVDAA